MITEDNRGAIGALDSHFNVATFEASKKLLKETGCAAACDEVVQDSNTLQRRLEIYEGEGDDVRHVHSVQCTGFNAAAPRLIYSADAA